MKTIKASALQKGDLIATISPSHALDKSLVDRAEKDIQAAGYKLYRHPHIHERLHRQAGSLEQRVQAIHDVFENPDIKAIIVTSGGNRTLHLLDHLDYDLIARNPKYICGYSDISALLNAIYAKTGLVTIHGTDLHRAAKDEERDWHHFQPLLELLSGQADRNLLDFEKANLFKSGAGTGRLIGGNLTLLQNLIKTDYLSDSEDIILFIEDEKETLWNVDRMLLFMRRHGLFDKCKGLLIGGFSESVDYKAPTPSFGYDLQDLIQEHCADGFEFPIITNAPFGHIGAISPLPIGLNAELIATPDRMSLQLLENCTL